MVEQLKGLTSGLCEVHNFKIDNLEWVLGSQGKYDEAEEVFRRMLELRERVGNERLDTLGGMRNLAVVLDKQGKYDEAEEMY